MSAKKRKKAKSKKKEVLKEKPQRKLMAHTDIGMPSVAKGMPRAANLTVSVSKMMPPAASVVPLVSKEIPLVSKGLPQVSAITNTTIPKKWGILPDKKWGKSVVPAKRKREPTRPTDIGVFKFLGKVLTAPMQTIEMVEKLTSIVKEEADSEIETGPKPKEEKKGSEETD